MMAKKAKQETQSEQSERFLKKVQEMVDAGELNPIEADERFGAAMKHVAVKRVE